MPNQHPVHTSVMGTAVATADGGATGTIVDVVINRESGAADFLVVRLSGEDQVCVVPRHVARHQDRDGVFCLDVPADRLRAAPRVDPRDPSRLAQPAWERDINAFYGPPPSATPAPDDPSITAP